MKIPLKHLWYQQAQLLGIIIHFLYKYGHSAVTVHLVHFRESCGKPIPVARLPL
jgi:hypothetical protein